MASKTLKELYELLDAGESIRMELSKEEAKYFRQKLAIYKHRVEKLGRALQIISPKKLIYTYDDTSGIVTFKFIDSLESTKTTYEIL